VPNPAMTKPKMTKPKMTKLGMTKLAMTKLGRTSSVDAVGQLVAYQPIGILVSMASCDVAKSEPVRCM